MTPEMTPYNIDDWAAPESWGETFASLKLSPKDRLALTLADDRVSDYWLTPESLPQPNTARGEILHFRWRDEAYAGAPRDVWLYIPVQTETAGPANLIVFNDGFRYLGPEINASHVLDNLIARGDIPPTAALFVNPAEVGPGVPLWGTSDNRSLEYDTVSATYASFIENELLPVVRSRVTVTNDPAGRAICGMSSGGAGAVTAAFFRPDLFGNVISHCGSYVNIRGAHELPFMFRREPRKPIRVWHQCGSRDIDIVFGSIPLANAQLAAALAYRNYDYHYEFGTGGHTLSHGGAVFPEALRWIWRD